MTTVATHCPYCALQCGIFFTPGVTAEGAAGSIAPNPLFPVNKGGLCLKGWSAAATLNHPERLRTPLVRSTAGELLPVSWDIAFGEAAERLRRIQTQFGADAVGVFGGGSLTNEKTYLVGKFARVALGTAHVDYNGRFCMSSAAAAATRAFGIDRGLPFPLEDVAHAAVVLLVGGNPAETMPPIMQYFETQQQGGGRLIVVDPRHTATAQWARTHLQIKPGTDAALANGLLHVLIRDGLVDRAFIESRTEHFEDARRVAMSYWPDRVEQITGITEKLLVETAHALGRAPSAMVLTARGPEQQAQGVTNALAYINVALAIGAVGKPASGFGTLTGQGNGQGGREHGQKADQLPGYRRLDDPRDREHVARVWNVPAADLPTSGKSAYEILDSLGSTIHALVVIASNPVVSAPNALHIVRRLSALDTLIVSDFFRSETVEHADVVFPAAQWAEEAGTMTNLEGRVVLRKRAVIPPEGVKTDVDIIAGLAARLGKGKWFEYRSDEDVFDELRRATEGASADYSGITWRRIEDEQGVFWPCSASTSPAGTPRLFADAFPTPSGRARFHATPHGDIADLRDEQFPLLLTTGRVLAQYQSGTQTRRTPELLAITPEPLAEIHPVAAALAGVGDGDALRLTTRRGAATFTARVTRGIREDSIFVPFHWGGEQSVNQLTNAALDPVSRMPEFKVCAVRAERAPAAEPSEVGPTFRSGERVSEVGPTSRSGDSIGRNTP